MSCFPTPLIIWGYVELLGCVSLVTLICTVKIIIKIEQLFMGFLAFILLSMYSYPLHNLFICSFQIIPFVCKSFVLQIIPQLGFLFRGAVLGPPCFSPVVAVCRLFCSGGSERGLLSSYGHGLLIAVASLLAESGP